MQLQNPAASPGSEGFIYHSFEIILFLLGAFILGWLLHRAIFGSRYKSQIQKLEKDLKNAQLRLQEVQADLEGCNTAVLNIKGENAALSTQLKKLDSEHNELLANIERGTISKESISSSVEAAVESNESPDIETPEISFASATSISGEEEISPGDEAVGDVASEIAASVGMAFDAETAKAVFGKKIKEDDLKIIEGIGPKTESLLNNSSIHTWRQLGNTSVPQIQHIIDNAGERFSLINPSTWPKQSRMASDGDWVKLREYQEYLVGGVEPSEPPPVSSGLGSVHYVMGKRIKQDDLTIIEGIGPKIQELLHHADIKSWKALGNTSLESLVETLRNAGDRYRIHDPGTWAKQARFAAEGKWDELMQYQEFLDGGKEPS